MKRRGKKAAARRLASWMLADLYRLADVMRAEGRALDPGPWLKVGANVLSSAPPGQEEITRAAPARWGLDQSSLLRFATRCGIDCSAEDIALQVAETIRWRESETERIGRPHHIPLSADAIGKLLCVTEDERRTAKAWRIGTIDGSREDRIEAAKARHAQRQAVRRKESGGVARAEYLESCKARSKPWEAAGMSRAKWYRTGAHISVMVKNPDETGPCETGPCVNNNINPNTAGSGYALPSRHHPANDPPPESLADIAARLRRRRGFEPVAPYNGNDIETGGLAARVLEMALRNPPIRGPHRMGRRLSHRLSLH